MPRPKKHKPGKRTEKQRRQLEDARRSSKENISPIVPRPPPVAAPIPAPDVVKTISKRLSNCQRQGRRLRAKVTDLQEKTTTLSQELLDTKKMASITATKAESDRHRMERKISTLEDKLAVSQSNNAGRLLDVKNLKAKLKRAESARHKALDRVKSAQPILHRLKSRKRNAYSAETRRMARLLVTNGCARDKVGTVLSSLAEGLGATVKGSMSARTVGRVVLEGLVASNIQLGTEIRNAKALTISADGTSNRGVNYEARHIAMRVPDYSSGSKDVIESSTPKVRLLRVDSTFDHSADGAVKGYMDCVHNALDTFNRSPGAARLAQAVTVNDFLRALKGMNTDHASKEKSAAQGIRRLKQDASIEDLGDGAICRMLTLGTLANYLLAWNMQKIAKYGGNEAWNRLTELDQAKADREMMEEIRRKLGEEEYNGLPEHDRRKLDLFIWAGCCMHKDQNSFQAGNAVMMQEWAAMSATPPIVLANKANALTLRQILDPAANQSRPMTEDEQHALQQSTRGGVKVAALAGAIFRNKDDKKGQGDRHSDHFKTKVNRTYTRFPDTSNTRFGSHGDAATDLLQYLSEHIRFLEIIRLSKQSGAFTQIELNVLSALHDKPTLTELCAMALYHQAVSKPYMRAVRVDAGNVLDLGPLHVLVREFVEGIVRNPDVLLADLCSPTSHVEGSLDGKPWDNPEAIQEISRLIPSLPHVRQIMVAFFRGTLATWERFSAEFAPGGLIDEASAEEKHLAWMPATNDANEGALGQYRVVIRGRPSLTLHQYNALAMFRHNETQSFMDVMFQPSDHQFIMQEARRIDQSGLERIRKAQIVDFRLKVAQIRKEKEAARVEKAKADQERLSNIIIFTDSQQILEPSSTLKVLGDQLDAMRFRGLPDVPAKSRFTKKGDRQAIVLETLIRYQDWTAQKGQSGILGHSVTSSTAVIEDWEVLEEEEYDE